MEVTKRNRYTPFTALWWHENTVNAMTDLILCQTMGFESRTDRYAKLVKYCHKRTQEAIEGALDRQIDNCLVEFSTAAEAFASPEIIYDAIESAKKPDIK